jgi:hypothetical protein
MDALWPPGCFILLLPLFSHSAHRIHYRLDCTLWPKHSSLSTINATKMTSSVVHTLIALWSFLCEDNYATSPLFSRVLTPRVITPTSLFRRIIFYVTHGLKILCSQTTPKTRLQRRWLSPHRQTLPSQEVLALQPAVSPETLPCTPLHSDWTTTR